MAAARKMSHVSLFFLLPLCLLLFFVYGSNKLHTFAGTNSSNGVFSESSVFADDYPALHGGLLSDVLPPYGAVVAAARADQDLTWMASLNQTYAVLPTPTEVLLSLIKSLAAQMVVVPVQR
jgi:hypothetical protein